MQQGAMHDPLSDEPHQAYQAHRAAKRDGGDAAQSGSTPPAVAASAVISAEPQLRDLRKEAAAFVPRGLKRKKVAAVSAALGLSDAANGGEGELDGDAIKRSKPSTGIISAPIAVSAAPPTESATTDNTSPTVSASGGGLLGKLSSVLGPLPSEIAAQQKKREEDAAPKQGDDYRAFLAGLDQLAKG
jgi:hypothetical protein